MQLCEVLNINWFNKAREQRFYCCSYIQVGVMFPVIRNDHALLDVQHDVYFLFKLYL